MITNIRRLLSVSLTETPTPVTNHISIIISLYDSIKDTYYICNLLLDLNNPKKDYCMLSECSDKEYQGFSEFMKSAPFKYKVITPTVSDDTDLLRELARYFPSLRKRIAGLLKIKGDNPFLKELV